MTAAAAGRFVAFGEILIRLSPEHRELLLQTPRLTTWIGGAEANVATALARLGHRTAMVSAVPDNALGDAAIAYLRGQGADTSGILRRPGRMGLYFVTPGAGARASDVVYDRAFSSFAETPPETWDWDALLAGADRLHLSGITPALGPGGSAAALRAAEAAETAGVPLSFDGNYRAHLWSAWDGRPREILSKLIAKADLLFGNHRDIGFVLGQDYADDDRGRRLAADAAFAAFPKLRMIAGTRRRVDDADSQGIVARIDTPDRVIETPEAALSGIVDRIGAGDAFAAGILHGLRRGLALEDVARCGLALSCLKHSLPGDMSLFGQRDIDDFLAGTRDVRR